MDVIDKLTTTKEEKLEAQRLITEILEESRQRSSRASNSEMGSGYEFRLILIKEYTANSSYISNRYIYSALFF